MAKLVVVESPAKARTINKFLGDDYEVKATMGHVRDLPKKELGVDIENDFAPEYVIIRGRGKTIRELRQRAKQAEEVLIATDKDREGEAIGWHVREAIDDKGKRVRRILFDEITREAIQDAVKNPLEIDQNKVDAQQARRILDRLVGYKISPVLWRKVAGGLSAGRVQSVALRLICDREKEIREFVPREYWSIEAVFKIDSETFQASLWKVDGEKAEIPDQAAAESVVADLQQATYRVNNVTRKQVTRRPSPPFITSTLQQQASLRLGFSTRKTMVIAQQLYEGIELGAEGSVGLISYMRTDSTRISAQAQRDALEYIRQTHGKEYCPERPNVYKNKKSAQDAHEAIRPTSVPRHPDRLRPFLNPDQMKLYTLIWTRFVASQMAAARLDQMAIEVEANRYLFRATGSVVRFPGFMVLYVEDEDGKEEGQLPDVSEGQILHLESLTPSQHFTKPPPRYSEASLVKTLEEKGIGRPSTYSAIVNTIQTRKYVRRSKRRFYPTDLGEVVNELLVSTFPDIIDTEFTAALESKLDEVEEGKADWRKLLRDFYYPFEGTLEAAVKGIPTSEICEKCGEKMVIKWGRFGRFLACSGYPKCKNTKEFVETEPGDLQVVEAKVTDHKCERCGGPMIVKRGRYGEFLACQNYPECEFTMPLEGPSEVDGKRADQQPAASEEKCDKCGKDMVVKNGRYGKFLACSGYPACKSTKPLGEAKEADGPRARTRATDEKCEKCRGTMVVRQGRYGEFLACENYPKCKFTKAVKLNVLCPREGCSGELVEKRTKKRKVFYGCSKYPRCDFALWDRPVNEECPDCGAPFLVVERMRTGDAELRCIQEGCRYQADLADASAGAGTS